MFRIQSFFMSRRSRRRQRRSNVYFECNSGNGHNELRRALSHQCSFLNAVFNNDFDTVSQLLKSKPQPNVNDTDDTGRSALMIAADMGHIGIFKLLLKHGAELDDVLFRAIHVHSIAVVQEICDHCANYVKMDYLSEHAKSNDFPPWTTPVMLAARLNHYHILKILLLHGATMPSLQETQSKAVNKRHERALSCLHWYQATSSEAYILLTSDDPMQTSFALMDRFKKLCRKDVYYEDEYENLSDKLEEFTTKLLKQAKDSEEIKILLNAGEEDREAYSKNRVVRELPTRVRDAIRLKSKRFVAHANFQSYILERWYHGYIRWNEYPTWKFIAMTVLVGLLYPLWCICYLVTPNFNYTKSAYMRFIFHTASRLTLLCLLLYSTATSMQSPIFDADDADDPEEIRRRYVEYRAGKAGSGNWLSIMIYIWITGMTWREMKEVYWSGVRGYFKNIFNVVDFMQLSLYWISCATSIVSVVLATRMIMLPEWIAQYGNPPNYTGNETRADWHSFDPSLVSEATFAVANVLTFLGLLHMMVILVFVGPLQISLGGMMKDIMRFFFLFSLVWISFGMGLTQLYRTPENLKLVTCTDDCPSAFETFGESMGTLFWSMFDLIDLERLQLHENMWFTEIIGYGLYTAYMIIAVVVMLNALIAMMSNTYTRVEENTDLEWKVARTKLMMEFMAESATMPPPFNIVPSVKSIMRLTHLIKRKASELRIHLNQENGVEMEDAAGETETTADEASISEGKRDSQESSKSQSQEIYKTVIAEIMVRHIRTTQTNLARERQSNFLQAEVIRLKESNDEIRKDLYNLQHQIFMLHKELKGQLEQLIADRKDASKECESK